LCIGKGIGIIAADLECRVGDPKRRDQNYDQPATGGHSQVRRLSSRHRSKSSQKQQANHQRVQASKGCRPQAPRSRPLPKPIPHRKGAPPGQAAPSKQLLLDTHAAEHSPKLSRTAKLSATLAASLPRSVLLMEVITTGARPLCHPSPRAPCGEPTGADAHLVDSQSA
jgi:hypothetical protein